MSKQRNSTPALDRLASGVDCPQCGAWTDTECKTVSALPHMARIDKAVRIHQRGKPSPILRSEWEASINADVSALRERIDLRRPTVRTVAERLDAAQDDGTYPGRGRLEITPEGDLYRGSYDGYGRFDDGEILSNGFDS